jgi:hypothetical protein
MNFNQDGISGEQIFRIKKSKQVLRITGLHALRRR